MTRSKPSVLPLEDRAVPSAVRFDFGTGYSPVASGYTQVTEATTYNPTRGYGWTAGTVYSDDRGTPDAATRDFNFTADGTFLADVPAGDYSVAVTVGDPGGYPHDFQGVYLQGVRVDSVSTAASQTVTRTYAVTVADSQLTFRIVDLGGADPYAVVEALTLTPVGTAPTPPLPPPPAPSSARFDFGTASSPVASGSTRVTEATAYTAGLGYGWTAGTVYSADRGGSDAATRDFNFTADGTFAVDVPAGTYDVTVTLGDVGGYRHDRQEVILEGSRVDSVDTAAGQTATRTYTVAVADGQLTLRLHDAGGADPYAVIESLTLTPSDAAPTPPLPVPPVPPPGQFSIVVRSTGMTAGQQAIFRQAADRWEQVVVGDLPDKDWYGETVDDLLIDVSAAPVDGVGGIAGGTGALAVRMDSYLPFHADVQFDTADLGWLEANGLLYAVALHEMGHALGIGVIWPLDGLITGRGGPDPLFVGPQATAEYNARFGTSATGVPVEAGGGPGTAYSHWSEAVFGSELMTGWLNGGSELSRITVASLADMGYVVNLDAADPY